MSVRAFSSFVLAMPRDSVFWRLVEKEPQRVEGTAARDLIRHL